MEIQQPMQLSRRFRPVIAEGIRKALTEASGGLRRVFLALLAFRYENGTRRSVKLKGAADVRGGRNGHP